jgi:hypothetical protein
MTPHSDTSYLLNPGMVRHSVMALVHCLKDKMGEATLSVTGVTGIKNLR